LVDVRQIDLRTSLLGVPLAWPVSVAPMGGLILFHPEGDVEMARGAAKADTLQWLSGATGWPVEDVAKAGAAPQMFQLYHHGDRGWVGELLARVEASGYLAVALTVTCSSTVAASATSSRAGARARPWRSRPTRAGRPPSTRRVSRGTTSCG